MRHRQRQARVRHKKKAEPGLPKFANPSSLCCMSTMNISLPDALKSFVDEQVANRGYGTSSEYVRELIRRDQEKTKLRGLLLKGASSRAGPRAAKAYFDELRSRVRRRNKA